MPEEKAEYFTLVFKGDIRKLKKNPLRTDTPFGRAVSVSSEDAIAELDKYRPPCGG